MLINDEMKTEKQMFSFLALLNQYDYFSIRKENGFAFFATGIERSCGWVLKFMRKFATPVYSDGQLCGIIMISPTEFECKIGVSTYYICALHEKPHFLPDRSEKNWNHILDFADIEYINPKKCCYVKELDSFVLVIDPDLLGELTIMEELHIRRFINIRLQGNRSEMQMCRSVCFQCQIHSENHMIYAGMYDLENSVSTSSVMIYNSQIRQSMSEDEIRRYTDLWNFAQYLYHENLS